MHNIQSDIDNFIYFYKNNLRRPKFKGQLNAKLKDFFIWNESLKSLNNALDNHEPWLSPMAIRFMSKLSNIGVNKVLEFGGGGSTLFWLKKGKEVVTIEHNREWFDKVDSLIAKEIYNSDWVGHCVEAEKVSGGSIAKKIDDLYISGSHEYINHDFEKYATYCDIYDDKLFDISVVDGRARVPCAMNSVRKTKHIVVLDNSERLRYTPVHDALRSYSVIHIYGPSLYTRYFSTTTFFAVSSMGENMFRAAMNAMNNRPK